MILLYLWIIIGELIAIYYLIKNNKEYREQIKRGNLKIRQLILGIVLTIFVWPVTLYNQECRKK